MTGENVFNNVSLIGDLMRDPELKYTPQGTPVCNMRNACTSKYRSGDFTNEEMRFINVVVWGKQDKNASQHLKKRRLVLVEGRLQERRGESDGQQRSKFQVVLRGEVPRQIEERWRLGKG